MKKSTDTGIQILSRSEIQEVSGGTPVVIMNVAVAYAAAIAACFAAGVNAGYTVGMELFKEPPPVPSDATISKSE